MHALGNEHRIRHGIRPYWLCDYCTKPHVWPENKARKYCDRRCRDAAYYNRKVKGDVV